VIYTLHLCLLMAGFYIAGPRPVLFILAGSMAASWVAGAFLGGPDRIVAFILLDLFIVFAISIWRDRTRDRIVGLVSFLMIGWATAYVGVSHMDYRTYAAGVNCAAVVQLLIGGGMADDLGRRIDHWLDRIWPSGARALRYVAT